MSNTTAFPKLQAFIEELSDLDDEERLQTLVELADELPPIAESRTREPFPLSCRVQECQTPVHIWMDWDGDRLHLEADVPEKSPTVRGLLAIVVQSLQGKTSAQVLSMPDDWLPMLHLTSAMGMQRQQGLRGVIRYIKQETHRHLTQS
jgi:cysteine desulfuration protein SufE